MTTRVIKAGTRPFSRWEPPVLAAATVHCPACDKPCADGSLFCHRCNYPLRARSIVSPSAGNEWALRLVVAAIGFGVSLLVVVFCSMNVVWGL